MRRSSRERLQLFRQRYWLTGNSRRETGQQRRRGGLQLVQVVPHALEQHALLGGGKKVRVQRPLGAVTVSAAVDADLRRQMVEIDVH